MRSRFERADLLAAGLALCSFLLVEEFSVKVWLLIIWSSCGAGIRLLSR